ncbi:mannosyl-oligosaccharide 1,3-1,6-alpha-mannosidase activity protein [Coemansia spiralis]|uniref:Mannosyl-oligosaccharide 1,3-1,6-alpha-mannosidase activity protein n=2 Tax=Coemansia TaxID=4863 RepID=A0A9W8FZN7_9FUNG|nr:mannosyl-oligosaccharide 1,3-1,6-alpha-mannosidase activity protein [Coemansia umbellata]KAJ2621164.1 mannosyl-oligosaccharide 1,3-1,6-alpha-mannosidase activity protein [Coemansia sp. RSA 1358]KAJ2673084.1 mannosyl-oligosaccharide 1,3-1,6-alpha-mannosidase activity protein [Coemansia spiralis]
MFVPRRYIRSGSSLLAIITICVLFHANTAVLPWNKPSWAAAFGEPGPPLDREFPRRHKLPTNLTLHILPHSHSDVGWNYKFEDYYTRWVRDVLRSVASTLWINQERKFTWGDLAFLDLWMSDEGDRPNNVLPGTARQLPWRTVLTELVRRGQWEIVGGTYVSPDEGLTTWWAHNAIVDVGHRYLASEFNASTRVAWQIDNFGHFNTMPHLLANTGYDALVLGRMAFRDLHDFASRSDLQFLWQAPRGPSPLLTHFLSVHYAAPSKSFDFDNVKTCNAPALLDELIKFARSQVVQYPAHGHVLVMMGDDFRYKRAPWAFSCLDHLIDESRKSSVWRDVTLRYSTPSDYFAAIRPYLADLDDRISPGNATRASAAKPHGEDPRHGLRLHQGDFFPYQDKPYEQYWSGMLTTRPYLKGLVRNAEQIVQHVEALLAVARIRRFALVDGAAGGTQNSLAARQQGKDAAAQLDGGTLWEVLEHNIEYCRKQVAIGYHHDAITGTCTQQAFEDYALRLRAASRVAIRIGHYSLLLSSPDTALSAVAFKSRHQMSLLVEKMEQEFGDAKTEDTAFIAESVEAMDKLGAKGSSKTPLPLPGYSTATAPIDKEDIGISLPKRQRDSLVVPPELCGPDSVGGCAGAVIAVTNANLLSTQDQVVRLQLHSLDAALVDLATQEPIHDAQISALGEDGFSVQFLARSIPPFGWKSYILANVSMVEGAYKSTDARLLSQIYREQQDKPPAKDTKQKAAAVLNKGNVRVHLSVTPDNRVRISAMRTDGAKQNERVVLHELRQYFVNPHVQSSGAYIMHSFMLMYGIVFYIFGGALCAGLVVSCVIHRELLPRTWLLALRVPNVLQLQTWRGARQGRKVFAAGESPKQPAASLTLGEVESRPVDEDFSFASRSANTSFGGRVWWALAAKLGGLVSPICIGGLTGLLFTYYVEQLADIDRLNKWTRGEGAILALVVPSFIFGYLLSGVLRWPGRRCVLFTYGVAAAVVLTMFGLPVWHSRPLHTSASHGAGMLPGSGRLSFDVQTGPVCDVARVQVSNNAKVTYKLCADKTHLVQVTANVVAEVDREIVGQFELASKVPEGHTGSGWSGECEFDMFNGVDVVRRRYSRWTPIPGNYYPAVSHIALAGKRGGGLALHSLQAMGATCIRRNTLEVGLHRSLSANDFRGLSAPMVDSVEAAVVHFVDLGLGDAEQTGIAANAIVNALPLAFVAPVSDAKALAHHSGVGSKAARGKLARGCARFVGIQAEPLGSAKEGGGGPGSISVYARVQAMAGLAHCYGGGRKVDIDIEDVVGVSQDQQLRAFAASSAGDWSIGAWQKQRSEKPVERIWLSPGEQALFRFAVQAL